MKKLAKKQVGGPIKKQIKGSKGTYTATKTGKVMSGTEGKLTSIDTTGYSKGKKDYTVKTSNYVATPGRIQKVGATENKTVSRKEVMPTIKKRETSIKRKGGVVKSKKK